MGEGRVKLIGGDGPFNRWPPYDAPRKLPESVKNGDIPPNFAQGTGSI